MREKLDIIAVVGLAIVVIGGTVGAVNYFAKDVDVKLIAMRLEQKIKNDEIWFVEKQLHRLFDRHQTRDCMRMPMPDCQTCRELKSKLKKLR